MIVETIMRLKPVADNMSVMTHFRVVDQSLGLSESVGNRKVTRFTSTGCFSLEGESTSWPGRIWTKCVGVFSSKISSLSCILRK